MKLAVATLFALGVTALPAGCAFGSWPFAPSPPPPTDETKAAGLQIPELAREELPTIRGSSRKSRIEPALSGAAASLAGFDVRVACWSSRDWRRILTAMTKEPGGSVRDLAGFADYPAVRINLEPGVCRTLVRLRYGPGRRLHQKATVDEADALGVLAHESVHFTNAGGDEALAECRAVQLIRRTAEALELSAGFGASAAERYWAEIYPNMAANYRTASCHDGGELDLNPASSTWP